MLDEAIAITATGFSAATGAASARTAIPAGASGLAPNYIRVAGINVCYVKVGDVTVVATGNDVLIQPADSQILKVRGCTHIAYIQDTVAGKINVTPLEDL